MRSRYLLLSLLVPLSAANAQSAASRVDSTSTPQVPLWQVETVTVTALRAERPAFSVPLSLSTREVSSSQQLGSALSTASLLQGIPGLEIANRQNLSQGDRIVMRGIGSRASFGVRGMRIIYDGVPLTFADGQSQLNNLDISNVASVEVLQGPAAALYGNASGGVILLQSRRLSQPGYYLQPSLITGSDGLQQRQVSGGIASESGQMQLRLQNLQYDGYREHSAGELWNAGLFAERTLGEKVKFGLVVHAIDAPYLLNPSSLDLPTANENPRTARRFVVIQGAGKKVRQSQAGISLNIDPTPTEQLRFVVYGIRRDLDNPIPGRIIDLKRAAGGAMLQYRRAMLMAGAELDLQIGADIAIQSDLRQEFENEGIAPENRENLASEDVLDLVRRGEQLQHQDEDVRSSGLYALLNYRPTSKLNLMLGTRYDAFQFDVQDRLLTATTGSRRKMSAFSPTIGIAWRPQPLTMVFANITTAFQTPTTSELSNLPTGGTGFNPELDPESLSSFELGYRQARPESGVQVTLSAFGYRFSDMLIPYQVPSSEEIFFRNAGKARNLGAEAALLWQPNQHISGNFALSVQDFVFRDFEVELDAGVTEQLAGNAVPGTSPLRLNAGFDMRVLDNLRLRMNAQHQAGYFANDFNGPAPGSTGETSGFKTEAFTRLDISAHTEIKISGMQLQCKAGIENLLDTAYIGSIVPNAFGNRFFEPAAGRIWSIGLGLRFKKMVGEE